MATQSKINDLKAKLKKRPNDADLKAKLKAAEAAFKQSQAKPQTGGPATQTKPTAQPKPVTQTKPAAAPGDLKAQNIAAKEALAKAQKQAAKNPNDPKVQAALQAAQKQADKAKAAKQAKDASKSNKAGSSNKPVADKKLNKAVKKAGDFTDPSQVAQGQVLANQGTALANVNLNRLDEVNAFGNRDYVQNPDGTYTVKDSLSEPQQELFEQQAQTGTTGSRIAQGLLGGMPQQYDAMSLNQYMPQGSDQARQDAYNATYGQLSRDFNRDRSAERQNLEQSLADRGIPIGSRQYNDQLNRFDQQWSDRELSARNQATLSGEQAFQNSFNRGQQTYQNQLGAYQSNFTMPTNIAGNLQGLGQLYQPNFGQGITPIEQQGLNLQGFYDTATQAALKNKEIAAMQKMAHTGGAVQPIYPSMGGVAGAGVAQQPKQPTIGQNIASGITSGAAQGAANYMTRG